MWLRPQGIPQFRALSSKTHPSMYQSLLHFTWDSDVQLMTASTCEGLSEVQVPIDFRGPLLLKLCVQCRGWWIWSYPPVGVSKALSEPVWWYFFSVASGTFWSAHCWSLCSLIVGSLARPSSHALFQPSLKRVWPILKHRPAWLADMGQTFPLCFRSFIEHSPLKMLLKSP